MPVLLHLDKNPECWQYYRACSKVLQAVDPESYPKQPAYFHLYTEVRSRKELLAVKSFYATQDLDVCKLVLWSDVPIEHHPHLQHFPDIIYRQFDRSICKGTPAEHMTWPRETDKRHYCESDALRLIAPWYYEGFNCWFDMDMVLLRNWRPLLDHEWFYQWGSELPEPSMPLHGDWVCNAALCLKSKSPLHVAILEQLGREPPQTETCQWGLNLLSKVWRKTPFQVYPSAFFNIEWLISKTEPNLDAEIQRCWFDRPCPDEYLHLESFAWHWHNTSNKWKHVSPESKFWKLERYIAGKLKERGIE